MLKRVRSAQEGELSRPFEAGPARHVLHDAPHPIMGELQVPESRAFEFTEFPTAGGAAQHKAWSGVGVVPLSVTDIPKIKLANSWTGGVEAAETVK